MTDKEFDRLLKEALTSDDAPHSLNESIVSLAEKQHNKKAKIFKFVKNCSSLAAVFICAVAVLSYFNSDLFLQDSTAPHKEINTSTEKESGLKEETVHTESTADILSERTNDVQEKAKKAAPVAKNVQPTKESAENTADIPQSETASAALAEDSDSDTAAVADGTSFEETAPAVFSMRKAVTSMTLSMLFNDDFDYKSAISEEITSQIAALPHAEEFTFSGIIGNESFSLSEENILTIEFSAGAIAPEEHGELFFTVGTVNDGILTNE